MTAHTPGPWAVEEQFVKTNCVEVFADFGREDDCVVARVYSWSGDGKANDHDLLRERRRIEAVANARLVAAAPDLLAACEAYVRWLDEEPPNDPDPETVIKAAIVKATDPVDPEAEHSVEAEHDTEFGTAAARIIRAAHKSAFDAGALMAFLEKEAEKEGRISTYNQIARIMNVLERRARPHAS